jgi:hypothetical protein
MERPFSEQSGRQTTQTSDPKQLSSNEKLWQEYDRFKTDSEEEASVCSSGCRALVSKRVS